ncbi:unnamed protein product, partial [Nesidiocoris tenuis]
MEKTAMMVKKTKKAIKKAKVLKMVKMVKCRRRHLITWTNRHRAGFRSRGGGEAKTGNTFYQLSLVGHVGADNNRHMSSHEYSRSRKTRVYPGRRQVHPKRAHPARASTPLRSGVPAPHRYTRALREYTSFYCVFTHFLPERGNLTPNDNGSICFIYTL